MITTAIKPFPCISYNKLSQATSFHVRSVNDDFYDHVKFFVTFLDGDNAQCGECTYEITTRAEYVTWDATATGAYKIVAQALGLELVQKTGNLFEFEA
jgi:hypothetical protein